MTGDAEALVHAMEQAAFKLGAQPTDPAKDADFTYHHERLAEFITRIEKEAGYIPGPQAEPDVLRYTVP